MIYSYILSYIKESAKFHTIYETVNVITTPLNTFLDKWNTNYVSAKF